MGKNQVIVVLVVLCLAGTIWGSFQDKKSKKLEKQLVAMTGQAPANHAPDETKANAAHAATNKALAEVADLKSQNKKLLANAATLKGSVASLKKELEESDDGSQAIAVMQNQLDKRTSAIAHLKKVIAAAKAEVHQKNVALAAASEVVAGLENVKASLANSVDTCSVKNQKLSAEVEAFDQRIMSLEQALEDRTKLLVGEGEELARTKLNMNVLLSKIAAQKELAMKFLIIEELQQQLNSPVVGEVVVVTEVPDVQKAAPKAHGKEGRAKSKEAPAH